jgi:hypothetical protein
MVMKDDAEDVNNDKAYEDDTCDVNIDEARFGIEVGGYACKASVDYENGNDVVVDVFVYDDDDGDDPNDDIRICTCLKREW